MKKKFFPALSRYALMCIAFLPMLPVLRATEYITLLKTQTPQALKLESLGMLNDLVSFSVFALVLFIPYFLIFLLRPRTAQGLFISALCLLVLIQEGLIRYFSINLMPL